MTIPETITRAELADYLESVSGQRRDRAEDLASGAFEYAKRNRAGATSWPSSAATKGRPVMAERGEHPLAADQLPVFDAPTIMLYREQLEQFRKSYELLLQFASDVTSTDPRKMNMFDMERWRQANGIPIRDELIRYLVGQAGAEGDDDDG